MKFGSVSISSLWLLVSAIGPESSSAFHNALVVPRSCSSSGSGSGRGVVVSTTSLFGFRQSYQWSLEQYTKTGKIEINGKQVDPNEVVETITQDLQASQEEGAEAQQRLSAIEEQISERAMSMDAFQAEIQKKQLEIESKYKDMSQEAIEAANKEKMVATEAFKARELQLQRDMDQLVAKLEEEKDHVRQNQEMTNRILATRIELDTELGVLKKKYMTETKEWESKLQAEKAARDNDMAKAQAEVERLKAEVAEVGRLQQEIEEMSKERNSLSALFKQSMKIMFGMDD